jgi:hypothetical protein
MHSVGTPRPVGRIELSKAGLLARGSRPAAEPSQAPKGAQWSIEAIGYPLTVAGAATAWDPVWVVRTVFPINPRWRRPRGNHRPADDDIGGAGVKTIARSRR